MMLDDPIPLFLLGTKPRVSHGASSNNSYKMAKTDHRLQTIQIETEAPGEARRASSSCCDPRCRPTSRVYGYALNVGAPA